MLSVNQEIQFQTFFCMKICSQEELLHGNVLYKEVY